ncbi:MAG: hypothetical protein KBT46_08280 [Ruminococcus sp.]|nr:hypothetical protein [Candidatus Copronaster equi]
MDNIADILSSLSKEDMDNLKATAESVFGSQNSENENTQQTSGSFDIGSMLDPAMFAKLAQIIGALNSDGGKRCRLIEALKPNLSPKRRKKADEAMQILKLLDILPMIKTLTNRDDTNG